MKFFRFLKQHLTMLFKKNKGELVSIRSLLHQRLSEFCFLFRARLWKISDPGWKGTRDFIKNTTFQRKTFHRPRARGIPGITRESLRESSTEVLLKIKKISFFLKCPAQCIPAIWELDKSFRDPYAFSLPNLSSIRVCIAKLWSDQFSNKVTKKNTPQISQFSKHHFSTPSTNFSILSSVSVRSRRDLAPKVKNFQKCRQFFLLFLFLFWSN